MLFSLGDSIVKHFLNWYLYDHFYKLYSKYDAVYSIWIFYYSVAEKALFVFERDRYLKHLYHSLVSRIFREAIRPGLLPYCNALMVKASPNINGHWGTFRQLLLLWRQSFYVLLKQVFSLYNRFLFLYIHDTQKKCAAAKKVVVNNVLCSKFCVRENLFYPCIGFVALCWTNFQVDMNFRHYMYGKFAFLPILKYKSLVKICFTIKYNF